MRVGVRVRAPRTQVLGARGDGLHLRVVHLVRVRARVRARVRVRVRVRVRPRVSVNVGARARVSVRHEHPRGPEVGRQRRSGAVPLTAGGLG